MRGFFGLRQRVFRFFLRAVTGFLNDFGNVGSGSFAVVKRNLRFLAGKVHPCRFDKIFFVQHFFNTRSAGLTGHAFDLKTDFLLHGFFLLNVVGLPEKSGAGFSGSLWGVAVDLLRFDLQSRIKAAVFHRFYQRGGVGLGGVEFHDGILVFQAHFGLVHAVYAFEDAGNAFHAAAAGHAFDV